PLHVVRGAAVVPAEEDDRLADHLVGESRVGPGLIEAEDARHGVGRIQCVLAELAPPLVDLGRRERQDAAVEVGPEWLEAELKRRRDPEVPAGAAQSPEELWLLGFGRADEPAVGGHELDGAQVVDREPEVALEAADSPAKRQPGDAGVPNDADRTDEAVLLRCDVELAEERAAVRPGSPGPRIHLDAAHRRHVDEESAVRATQSGGAVPAGPDRDLEVVLARETDRGRDLVGA